MSSLCVRHRESLIMALELRGLVRPMASAAPLTFDELGYAIQLIVEHATNFAGRASIEMLAQQHCPLCFINAKRLKVRGEAQLLNVDGWVQDAADDTLAESAARRFGEPRQRKVLV